jgi:sugar-specific transcriptional regulator TrmB
MDFISLLREYGFSEREAKIYLTCLEFGEDIPSSIARRARENRVTTYSILKDLTKK